MTFTCDYSTYIGQMRNYIGDTNPDDYEFEDEQLDSFYSIRNSELCWAIYDALRSLTVKYNKSAGDEYKVDSVEYKEGKSKSSVFNTLLNQIKEDIDMGVAPGQELYAHTYGIYTQDYEENLNRILDGEIIGPRHYDRECDQVRIKNQDGPYYNG